MSREISDEILSAHIDNELDPAERAELLDRIATDASLRGRACELWQIKQMVRGAYPLPRQAKAPARRGFAAPRWLHALAATLLLAVGALSGWFAHGHTDAEQMMLSQIDTIRASGGRVVLHLFSDEPARMEAALVTAERLARERDKAGQPFRVEFIANGPGLHLLRTGGSPYAARVMALHETYENLHLVACQQAMRRLRERGIDVTLLPGVEEAPSAESELATRLTQGWRYLQT
jgi:intracellular sulfur oxidation DsrE/DsrF family protein